MATKKVIFETPKTIRRTILAVGKIHYQPPTDEQNEALEVTGRMLIRDEIQPVKSRNIQNKRKR